MVDAPIRDPRQGGGLVESLVALLLTTGLLILMGGIVVHHQRAARTLADRTEGVESGRLTRDLISMAIAADPEARVDGGQLFVRSFVGTAARCGEVGWSFRGRRLPDPTRDSIWAVTAGGIVQIVALSALASSDCPGTPGLRGLELRGDPPLALDVRLARVFESGRYRVDDALRYGRSGTGAQPLSASVLDPSRSTLRSRGGVISASVVPLGRGHGYSGRWVR